MTKQLKADLMLILVTLFWGVSYLLIDISFSEINVFTLNALRFLIAFIAAGILAFPKLKTVNRITLKYSALLGAVLLVVYIGATYGVRYTSLSNAGFLCALTVVITPVLAFIFQRKKPDKKLLIAVVMCLVGIGLLTLNEQLRPALGDILCILCAFAYAVDLLITENAVKKEEINAFQLGVFQLGFTGIYNLVLAFFVENPVLPKTPKVWVAVLFLAVFCTGAAFIIQVLAQQYTSASHVGVIFSLEPVFAGIVAFAFAGEVLTMRAYFGAILLISSIFAMELEIPKVVTSFKNFVKNKIV
ncbi:DMT family transporter [Sinanaerobacter chloroacetimidivorans]|jgi:drug/metabolite transporter (DMT)-like permease|uniref:DMT family transporter n=1 Tax=Sinanaerobacter chloroacetimidivorans TaxID=2818044 RepID=A0A8J7W261_9FIRM|nr:DMT family transporter [Sinanaerobacter chloroacetimidivorans]MBR0599517.1 DMT family transporter [Sinanaerobacter chloroacetimidivorans]